MEIRAFKLKIAAETGMTDLTPASLSELLTTDFMTGERGRGFVAELSTKTYIAEITGETQSVCMRGLKSRDETLRDRPEESFVIILDPSNSDRMACMAYKEALEDAKQHKLTPEMERIAKDLFGDLSDILN